MKTIIYSVAAAKQLDDLPAAAYEQVTRALHDYATTGAGDVKKLSGRESYRLRVGRYRVVFDEDTVTVMAIYVGKRDTTTYRKK